MRVFIYNMCSHFLIILITHLLSELPAAANCFVILICQLYVITVNRTVTVRLICDQEEKKKEGDRQSYTFHNVYTGNKHKAPLWCQIKASPHTERRSVEKGRT